MNTLISFLYVVIATSNGSETSTCKDKGEEKMKSKEAPNNDKRRNKVENKLRCINQQDRSVKEGGDKKQIIVLQLKEERCLAIVKNEQAHLDWLEQEIESVRGHIVRKKEKIKGFKAMKKQSKEPLDLKCRLDADYHIVKSTLRKGDLRRDLQELKKQREKSKKRILKYKNKVLQFPTESGTSEDSAFGDGKPICSLLKEEEPGNEEALNKSDGLTIIDSLNAGLEDTQSIDAEESHGYEDGDEVFCYLRRLSSEIMVQCLYIISACPLYLCVRLSV